MQAATEEEDKAIRAVQCVGYCIGGLLGMDRCGKCNGAGSQLSSGGRRFPNTERGYTAALVALRSIAK